MLRPALLLSLLVSLPVTSVPAQIFRHHEGSDRHGGLWFIDVAGQFGQPQGAFRDNVKQAWGVGASARYHFPGFRALGVRADGVFLNYGNERKRVPLSATLNRVIVDMHTANNIGLFTLGPELMVMRGPIRPYVFAFGGYSQFFTESSANDHDSNHSFASSVNFSDGGWAAGWGGGVRIPLSSRRVSTAIDAGARLTHNGTRSYLRRGDVIDQPDGSLVFNERRTPADLWQYHLGVSFMPRRGNR